MPRAGNALRLPASIGAIMGHDRLSRPPKWRGQRAQNGKAVTCGGDQPSSHWLAVRYLIQTDQLGPCPRCGREARLYLTSGNAFLASCDDGCGCEVYASTVTEVLEIWNFDDKLVDSAASKLIKIKKRENDGGKERKKS
jgi:hypothetical protein